MLRLIAFMVLASVCAGLSYAAIWIILFVTGQPLQAFQILVVGTRLLMVILTIPSGISAMAGLIVAATIDLRYFRWGLTQLYDDISDQPDNVSASTHDFIAKLENLQFTRLGKIRVYNLARQPETQVLMIDPERTTMAAINNAPDRSLLLFESRFPAGPVVAARNGYGLLSRRKDYIASITQKGVDDCLAYHYRMIQEQSTHFGAALRIQTVAQEIALDKQFMPTWVSIASQKLLRQTIVTVTAIGLFSVVLPIANFGFPVYHGVVMSSSEVMLISMPPLAVAVWISFMLWRTILTTWREQQSARAAAINADRHNS